MNGQFPGQDFNLLDNLPVTAYDLPPFFKVDVRKLPDDVLNKHKTLSNEVVSELAVKNKAAEKIYDSYNKFYKQVSAWYEISEKIYFNVR